MEEGEWPRYFYGTPERVHEELVSFAGALELDELIAVTIVHGHRARLRSYELLAEVAAAHASAPPHFATAGS
jgi:alkanesulfonate monooxygenase SsuD/methylene tetrahydromethanopterin reductase-like flavin-dependent oxidoreductase (luciferase family)